MLKPKANCVLTAPSTQKYLFKGESTDLPWHVRRYVAILSAALCLGAWLFQEKLPAQTAPTTPPAQQNPDQSAQPAGQTPQNPAPIGSKKKKAKKASANKNQGQTNNSNGKVTAPTDEATPRKQKKLANARSANYPTPLALPPAYVGVPYDVQLVPSCLPNCAPVGADTAGLDQNSLKSGRIKFAPQKPGTLDFQLTGGNASPLEITIAVGALAPDAGTPANHYAFPSIVRGEQKFDLPLPFKAPCTTVPLPINSSDPNAALPAGFLTPDTANPLVLHVDPTLTPPGDYAFNLSCKGGSVTEGFFSLSVKDALPIILAPNSLSMNLCDYGYNDCDWVWWAAGGGEESALSAQDSQTNPFITLFVRAPLESRVGSVWLLARFLGAANANNTSNVVAELQTATGTGATAGLPQVGTAVDYTIGVHHDFLQATPDRPDRGRFTVGLIAGFGATTPLSAQHATTAYVVPAYGTNECNTLLQRFPSSRGSFGLPAQPSSPYITSTPITTPTPPTGQPAPTITGPFCIINPVQSMTTTTSNGATTVTTVSGVAQTNIAFAPEDRNSFLLKYMVGLRLINRWHSDSTKPKCGVPVSASDKTSSCVRTLVDMTLGQDEAITGGLLRHLVAKADAIFPVSNTGIFFFGAASVRVTRNQNFSPLVLQQATIVTSSPSPPNNILVPSASTWVLPLTQPNRDFYRVGIGFDVSAAIAKLLPTPK